MASKRLDRLLTQLEECRYRFGPGEASRTVKLLRALSAIRFRDAQSLMRFHEVLLFLRAFPPGPAVVHKTEALLNSLEERVIELRHLGVDLTTWDTFESSGVSGTVMEDTLSYDLAHWLVERMPGKVQIARDHYEPGREACAILPRLMPLLEDDCYVEADTPWQKWMEAAQGKKMSGPQWLLRQFEGMRVAERERAELYEALRFPLRWDLGNSRFSRTRNWERPRQFFYHDQPLLSRSQVSLSAELSRQPPALLKLSRRQGERVMKKIREVMLVRYRELYGTTLGDPASVVRADLGRGLSINLWNLPPDRRLPLRSYVAGLGVKNGVPINYIEAIGLCEWMEVGFNTFYTFRGGETAWVYAQVLRCLCHLMGTTCVSVYPYQLGHDNEEAIESGAFWFYRKLGFRPGRPELLRLVESEERKIAANPKYRTSPRTLRRLAASHVFYELPGSEVGAWDGFSTRNIGLRVNARMAREFSGNVRRTRDQTTRAFELALGVKTARWTPLDRLAFENFALIFSDKRDVENWTAREKKDLVRMIRAKGLSDEMQYLHLTQSHLNLRALLLQVGTSNR